MRAAQLRRVFGLTSITLLSGLVSCKSPVAASETPMTSETTNAAQQRVVGTLTRKGAEFKPVAQSKLSNLKLGKISALKFQV
jgi:hypothetical protein